jgi:DNA primase
MRQEKTAIIAEGYMDVIALHQAGFSNAVAPLGTSFTDEQAQWLRRWIERAILIFDNDDAGQKAAYKAIITCRKNGISCSLINTSQAVKEITNSDESEKYKDPADILQKFGSEILKKVLNCTINDIKYLISLASSIKGGVNRAAAFLFPYLDALDSEVERDDSLAQIADALRIERAAVQKDFQKWKRGGNFSRAKTEEEETRDFTLTVRRNAELLLLTVVAVNQELYPEFRAALEIKEIDDPAAKELFIALEECFAHDESGIDSLLARIKDESLKAFIVGKGSSPEFKGYAGGQANEPYRLMKDGINEIKKKKHRKRLTEIGAQIREIERSENNSLTNSMSTDDLLVNQLSVDQLLEEKKTIDLQIRKLEGK